MDNLLALEPLLIDRVRDQVTGFRRVLGAPDLAGVTAKSQTLPACYVLFWRDSVPGGDSARSGCDQIVQQTWLAVVAVRTHGDTTGGSENRQEAGPLMGALNRCLQGWKPGQGFSGLRRVTAPPPRFAAGYGYYPQAYQCQFVLRGTND